MITDTLTPLLSIAAFFIYGVIFIISLIFTFSLELYCKIEEVLNFRIIGVAVTSFILDRNIDWVNTWLMQHNKIVGSSLALLSIIDLRLFLDIIWTQ